MSVIEVMAQLEEEPGLQPLGVLPVQPHREGQLVGQGEAHPQLLVHQQIGVVPQDLQGPVPVPAVEGHGELKGQSVGRQELQQAAHPHLGAEVLSHGQGPLPGDAVNFGQQLRALLQDVKRVGPELLHHPLCGGRADAPHRARGQIVEDRLLPCGHSAVYSFGFELLPVGGVAHPASPDGESLAGGRAGHTAHHGYAPLLPAVQLENCVAVLLVLVDDSLHSALYEVEFLAVGHGAFTSSVSK